MKRPKKTNARFRHRAFTIKLFLSMTGCLILMLLFTWLMNTLALEDFYLNRKNDDLASVFSQIDTAAQNTTGGAQLRAEIDRINARSNYSIVLLNNRMQLVYVSMGGMETNGWNEVQVTLPLNEVYENGTFVIKVEKNERVQQEYLALTGRLTDGTWCVMRSPLEAISESAALSRQFLIYSGIVVILFGGVLAFLIARSFTKPISQLVEVTDSLARLDFSKKFTGKTGDEIELLGDSINHVSTELERNLSELKTVNAQLQRDNEIKTRQDQLRRDFIANASHELKTPIALIRAYAEGVSEDVSEDPESRRYYCEIIQDEADKMNQLIKKMTSLMQLESGEEELNISRFELTGLVNGILRRYSILLDQKRIAFSFRYDRELYCWGDEYFIENVINNYISNAANHASAKGEIVVSAGVVDGPERPRVRVTVFNTGEHISEEDLSRIWESFYKVDKARTREYGGTGLGLSVVSAIMRAHNMPCGVQNDPGGVSFWFELEQA